jgi:hypothetical protein
MNSRDIGIVKVCVYYARFEVSQQQTSSLKMAAAHS